MTEQEIEKHKVNIDAMSQMEMARLWRFAPCGEPHPYFDSTTPLADYFIKKFKEKGGMTSEISKAMRRS